MNKLFSILVFCSASMLNTVSHADQQKNIQLPLDGEWQIIFDDAQKSKPDRLYLNSNFLKHPNIESINVPSVWERTRKDYEGIAVYRKTFKLPSKFKDKIVHLNFDAVNYRSEVYLNDEVVGVHEGGFTPFSFRIDKLLKPDEMNSLTVRVIGPVLLDRGKVLDGMGAMETPQWRGGITGGIWQSVSISASGTAHIEDLYVTTKLANNTANVQLKYTSYEESYADDSINIFIVDLAENRVVANVTHAHKSQPGTNDLSIQVAVKNAKLWSPDSPNLYRIEAIISRGHKTSDSSTKRFGFREFTVKNNRFFLNNEEIYVKAVFLEGVYPVGIAAPDNIELARKEIRLAKEAGFNMIRPWRRPPPPQWLDLADEMGVMVIGSPALECMDFPVTTPDLPRRVMFEVEQSILRDRSRASVVMWELFNELRRPVLKQMMTETAMMARDTDASRLILDESGGWAFGAKVYLPYQRVPTPFNDVHTYPGPNMTNHWYDKFLGVGLTPQQRNARSISAKPIGHNLKAGVTSFVSELGYGSYVDFNQVNALFAEHGEAIVPATRYHRKLGKELQKVIDGPLADVYASSTDFYNEQQRIHGLANARMIEATRANPNVAGYCVHALTGGDWIMGAGILDLWRNPKPQVYELTKAANAPRILSIRAFNRSSYQGKPLRVTVTGINDHESIDGVLKVQIKDVTGSVVFENHRSVQLVDGVAQLFDEKLNTDQFLGSYTIYAILSLNDKTTVQNSFNFDVFTPLEPNYDNVAVVDEAQKLGRFLDRYKINYTKFDSDTAIDTPVLVAMRKQPNERQAQISEQLSSFAKRGGQVIFLQFPSKRPTWNHGVLSKGSSLHTPHKLELKASTGLWGGMSHIVRAHPIFSGLPQDRAMLGVYENIRASLSMTVNLKSDIDVIVPVVANDNFPEMTLMNRHYKGPGDVWTASDLSIHSHGNGVVVYSTMSLVDNLNSDPVAERIVHNLIGYVANQ